MRILGKGLTAQALQQKFPDAVMYDDNDKDKYDFSSEELTVVSPGIPPSNVLVQHSLNTCSDYDLFSKSMPFSIWISGTNGKTTTTQMIQHLLSEYGSVYGGNIGVPVSALDEKAKYWILESSSFTLHYTNRAKPNIYVLLPISDDHLSWHGTFKEYENSKLKPLSMMGKDDVAIIPHKYRQIQTQAQVIYYKDSADLAKKFDIDINKIKFNDPFLLDSLLALVCAKFTVEKIDYDKINSFKVDEHKVEELYDKQRNLWVNDSKATNIDATIWALKGYANKKIYLILGGDDKGADLNHLFKELKKYDLNIYTVGSNAKRLLELAQQYKIDAVLCNTIQNAVQQIKTQMNSIAINRENSVAILSPAASSLDQFSSYSQRGKEFKNLVLN